MGQGIAQGLLFGLAVGVGIDPSGGRHRQAGRGHRGGDHRLGLADPGHGVRLLGRRGLDGRRRLQGCSGLQPQQQSRNSRHRQPQARGQHPGPGRRLREQQAQRETHAAKAPAWDQRAHFGPCSPGLIRRSVVNPHSNDCKEDRKGFLPLA